MLHDLSRKLRRLLDDATSADGSRPAGRQASKPNVIRLPNALGASQRPRPDWRQRLLVKVGARMHATSVERGDGCSIAILDSRGMVVTWHDSLPGAARFDFRVIGMHVSQFYLPQDIAFKRPDRRLQAASLHGSDTQQGWYCRPGGSIFWGVTVIEALRNKSGELQGYSHVTRYLQDPSARLVADSRCSAREYSAWQGAVGVA